MNLGAAAALAAACAWPQEPVAFTQPGGLDDAGPIVFSAQIEDAPVTLLLDTGAGRSVLDATLVERLGIASGLPVAAAGVGGLDGARLITVPSLRAGGHEFRQFPAIAMDLTFLDFDGARVDGILGSDLLRQCRVELDFEADTLRFLDPDLSEAPEGYLFETLDWFMSLPVLAVELDGRPVRALLDTGNLAMTTLHGPFFRRHYQPAAGPRIQVRGVGGELHAHLGRLGALQVGGVALADLPAITPAGEDAAGLLNSSGVDANVGVGVLRHFRVLFDYPENRLGLAPRHAPLPPAARGQLGVRVQRRDGAFVVRDVWEGSDAAAAAIAAGDRILAVDGRETQPLTAPELQRLLYGEPGTRVRLTVCSGAAERTVELERREYAAAFTPKE